MLYQRFGWLLRATRMPVNFPRMWNGYAELVLLSSGMRVIFFPYLKEPILLTFRVLFLDTRAKYKIYIFSFEQGIL
jgi:hypothetical protein